MLSNKSVYCSEPFDHWIIDNFLDQDVAESLTNEFIDFDDSKDVVHYKGWIGDKKTCNVWNRFPATCLLYTSPSPRDKRQSRMPSSA